MPSILPNYEYDIFISYRQNDNKRDGWVTNFVAALKDELEATLKNPVSIYFDENPHDGLLETHQVNASLEKKLKCLVFIPIISQTYCDPNSFAWEHELLPFNKLASEGELGMNITLANGNVASRVLPVKIHDLDNEDQRLIEDELQGPLRAINFIYSEPGVNRPLKPEDTKGDNQYNNQINKVANALKDLGRAMLAQHQDAKDELADTTHVPKPGKPKIHQELIRRNVFQAGLIYIILSLLVWKLGNLTVAWLDLPDIINNIIASTLFLIFPIAMVLAYIYENSPSGLIRIGSKAAEDNPFTARQKKPLTNNTIILSLMVVTMAIYFLPQKNSSSNNLANTEAILANKSIAVLYFDNMSGDPEQEFFSDGITEEIIARLAQIKGLRVISRTSTLVYKGQPLNLKKIADELNVTAVLEGSFRRSGNQIKVTAQLINAETDEHIWAETFTRELKDVFAVQAEIAHEIANKFKVDISPETNLKISKIPTQNLEAYEYFLRGKHIAMTQYYFRKEDSAAFYKSREMYEKAIALDPDFAEAYAGLGDLYDANRNKTQENFTAESDSLRHALSKKAINLAPNSSWVNNTRAWTYINRKEPKLDSGFYFLRKAFQLDPNNAYNMATLASFYGRYVGLEYHGIRLLNQALELDPLDAQINGALANIYNRLGDIEQWYKYRTITNELRGESNEYLDIDYLILKNDIDAAKTLLQGTEFDEEALAYYQALILAKQGKKTEAQKIIREKDFSGLRLWLVAGMKTEMIERMKKFSRWGLNRYLALKENSLWDPYREDDDFKLLISEAKEKYEANLQKYGPYVDEVLSNY